MVRRYTYNMETNNKEQEETVSEFFKGWEQLACGPCEVTLLACNGKIYFVNLKGRPDLALANEPPAEFDPNAINKKHLYFYVEKDDGMG